MPFRCSKCNRLSATDEFACNCPIDKQVIRRVSVVHYMSTAGTGRLIARGRKAHISEEDSFINKEPLKLNCNTTAPSPVTSPHLPAVTCLACLAANDIFPDKEPVIPYVDPEEDSLEEYLSS